MAEAPKPRARLRDPLTATLALMLAASAGAAFARVDRVSDPMRRRQAVGADAMMGPITGPLLAEYYEAFLLDRDLAMFRERVDARYAEETLCRVLEVSPYASARRGAVLALGVTGTFDGCNATLGRALRDDDAVVRTMAERALWVVWFRADTSDNNHDLEEVRALVSAGALDEAVERAGRLITRSPKFAEAYNQRAIAYYKQRRFAESAEDCIRTLTLNPVHVGALSGLAQCQVELNQPREALKTLRRSLKLQPYSEGLNEHIRMLEARLESDGPR